MYHKIPPESKTHGQPSFPYTVYKGKIPAFFPSYPLHWHDEMELIYVYSGHGMITVQSHSYIVKADDIVIVPPQMVHSIEQHGKSQMEYFNVLFQFSLLNYSTNDACYEKYFKPLYSHTNDKLKDLLLYIQSNYNSPIPVKDAAAVCGFSSSHFMKLFKELTGKSFSQYLIDYRLEIAARQLVETSDKIIDPAENVGFHNASYFSRAFQSKYGETPSAYRNHYAADFTASRS